MIRRIIVINEDKCNGCGLCAQACHEGAIAILDGKAKLLRADYCDGLGDCLPACPMDAISFQEREAPAYNEAAVFAAKKAKSASHTNMLSQPQNFPVQLKLVPENAPWFNNAELLVSADCCAYSYGNFHNDFMKDKVTIIACPKLDSVNYAQKLTQIFANNEIKSITVTRMTVPCCGGLPYAVQTAIENCGKKIPLKIVTIAPDGRIIV